MHDLSAFINCSGMLKDLTGHVIKPCVVILGSTNSGKSTLINSLLGLNISRWE
jgi:ribosome biogenesis GTPase A